MPTKMEDSFVVSQDENRMQETKSLNENLLAIVQKQTNGKIDRLQVMTESDTVILTGYSPSFYIKQIAQQAVMQLEDGFSVSNQIKVI